MWKNNGPTEHTDENLVNFTVEPLPTGIAAYLAREGEHWRFRIAVDEFESVESEARFDSASEAATGLESWLADCRAA
jgi:hypothetical protein